MDAETTKMDMETDPHHGQTQKDKQKRILACVLCQQRKIKCDRKFPCVNCIKSNADCQPAVAVKRRRRTKPELEIVSRIRKYESLLRENNIAFEPLIGVPSKSSSRTDDKMPTSTDMDVEDEGSFPNSSTDYATPSTVNENERVFSVKRFWQLLDERHNEDTFSDVSESERRPDVAKTAWDGIIESDSHLLFGSPSSVDVDLSTLHPSPAEIFKLWQIYLQNVDPLLKVTHIPTLQARIVDAVSHIADIDSNLEALMFSIYAISTMTLDEDDCLRFFNLPKKTLSTRYYFGCQIALTNCGFLRTSELDCLTAMYLYLVAVMPVSLPGSLSSLLAIAIRIAQRIGIDMESHDRTPLEAELSRRLWWSLVLFDSRISELADAGTTTLTPLWNAKLPLNANDLDFRADMKEPPEEHEKPTEAIFAVVRCILGDALRRSRMHLRHIYPALQILIKDVTEPDILALVEDKIESQYLSQCDLDIPIQYMTTWMTRGFIAKAHLFKFYAPNDRSDMTEDDRDKSMQYAITMLECDTRIATWPLTKGLRWMLLALVTATEDIASLQTCRSKLGRNV